MTTMTETNVTDPGLPGVHQGDAPGDLGRDHDARVDAEVRLRRPGEYDLRPGGAYRGARERGDACARAPGGGHRRRGHRGRTRRASSCRPGALLMDHEMAAEGFTRLT